MLIALNCSFAYFQGNLAYNWPGFKVTTSLLTYLVKTLHFGLKASILDFCINYANFLTIEFFEKLN